MTNFLIVVPLLCGGLFLGMLLFIEIGRRIGVRQHSADPDGARAGVSVVDGAVFTLLALIVAFTFSGAATRFDDRRHLVVEEANDIEYPRLGLIRVDAIDQALVELRQSME